MASIASLEISHFSPIAYSGVNFTLCHLDSFPSIRRRRRLIDVWIFHPEVYDGEMSVLVVEQAIRRQSCTATVLITCAVSHLSVYKRSCVSRSTVLLNGKGVVFKSDLSWWRSLRYYISGFAMHELLCTTMIT